MQYLRHNFWSKSTFRLNQRANHQSLLNIPHTHMIIRKENIIIKFNELFFFRGREKRQHPCVRETLIRCLSKAPNWGPGLQSRHVP